MHAAPPLRMNLAPDRRWQAFTVACTGVAAANLAAWLTSVAEWPGPRVAAAALLAAALASLACLRWVRRLEAPGLLVWDGANWSWSGGEAPVSEGRVRVMIDLGAWMLLRFESAVTLSGNTWLAASRRQAGALWPAWRTALLARLAANGQPAAPDPT